MPVYCCNGEVYRNVRDLEAGLERMRDDYFAYHANPEKNDFSKWVKDVIDDGYLAAQLAACRTREEALEVVTKRLARLEKPRARRPARAGRTYAPAKAETSART